MKAQRFHASRRSLVAETLERRDLLAADFFQQGAAAGAVDCTAAQVQQQLIAQSQATALTQLQQQLQTAVDAVRQNATLQQDKLQIGDQQQICDAQQDQLRTQDQQQDQQQDQSRLQDPQCDQQQQQDQQRDQLLPRDRQHDQKQFQSQLRQRDQVQDPVQIQALTDAEIDALVFVREEEKLARDVYATLGAAWGDAVFSNIAVAEQNHMDAVKTLLDKHEIVDPVTDDSVGVFTNPVLQQLYDDLTSDAVVDLSYAGVDVQMQGGASSYLAALQVGAFIEEFDILDLMRNQDDIAAPDVANVFANLLAGSENHLRAFNARLEAVGNPYEPVLMTGMDAELGDLDALYASIIGAEQATGQQNAGTQRQARDGAFAQLATT